MLGAQIQTENTARSSNLWFSKRGRRFTRSEHCGWCGDDGRWQQKLQVIHLSFFPSVGRGGGNRPWTSRELHQAKSMQIRMMCRILGMWPKLGEAWPAYAKWTARWAETLAGSQIRSWEEALAILLRC